MIVKGILSTLGSGSNLNGICTYNSIGFEDGQEIIVNQTTRIAVPGYIADKLSLNLGKHLEISLTDNKKLVTAVKIDGRIYRIDGIQSWMPLVVSDGLGKIFIQMGWPTIVFPPLFILYMIFSSQAKNQILSSAKAFD
jgi:hypothetical protein